MKKDNDYDIEFKKIALIVVMIALFIGVIIYLFKMNPALFQNLVESYGLIGLFIVTIVSNATIVLPLPVDILIFLFADFPFFPLGIFNPLLLALIISFAASIGEMSAYLVGLFGVSSLEKMKSKTLAQVEEMELRLHKLGMIVIILGALTPFPFDVIGIAAGLLRFDVKKFFIGCYIGKFFRYLIIAYAGYYSLGFIRSFFGF